MGTVKHAREVARQWILDEARRIPGFRGAYTAGSTNWLPADAQLNPASDLDIVVVLSNPAGPRHKFLYHDTLLEVSYLCEDQLQSPEQVLPDYHLAPSLATAKVVVGINALQAAVSRDYANPNWIRRRSAQAMEKVRAALRSADLMGCLFAAGITTHVLLAAGLKNPTVRTRYVAVKDLLSETGHLDFHETLLELLGSARITKEQARRHLAALEPLFDAAARRPSTLPYACDVTPTARPIAIEGSRELIAQGHHREAMFWIGVTRCRCLKILDLDTPPELATPHQIRERRTKIEQTLPALWDLTERILSR